MMRVPVPAPYGQPGDRVDPATRTKLPTSRQWPAVDHTRQPIRRDLYAAIKAGPITAAAASELSGLPLLDALDELRLMESWMLCRHVVDAGGVVRWRWSPANSWETEPPPF